MSETKKCLVGVWQCGKLLAIEESSGTEEWNHDQTGLAMARKLLDQGKLVAMAFDRILFTETESKGLWL